MTRLQAVYLYLGPRTKTGGVEPYGPPKSVLRRLEKGRSAREEFFDRHRLDGLPDWRISQLWDAMLKRAEAVPGMGKGGREEFVRALRERERGKRRGR